MHVGASYVRNAEPYLFYMDEFLVVLLSEGFRTT